MRTGSANAFRKAAVYHISLKRGKAPVFVACTAGYNAHGVHASGSSLLYSILLAARHRAHACAQRLGWSCGRSTGRDRAAHQGECGRPARSILCGWRATCQRRNCCMPTSAITPQPLPASRLPAIHANVLSGGGAGYNCCWHCLQQRLPLWAATTCGATCVERTAQTASPLPASGMARMVPLFIIMHLPNMGAMPLRQRLTCRGDGRALWRLNA